MKTHLSQPGSAAISSAIKWAALPQWRTSSRWERLTAPLAIGVTPEPVGFAVPEDASHIHETSALPENQPINGFPRMCPGIATPKRSSTVGAMSVIFGESTPIFRLANSTPGTSLGETQ